jgi:RNA polymerase sigma factor (sigma-70 family)
MAIMAEELDLSVAVRGREPTDAEPLVSRELWLAVAAGDNTARERFYHCYAEPVHRAIGGWAHSLRPDEREDMLSDIFLKAFQHAGALQDFSRLEGWLFGLARNTVMDHCRKRGRAMRELKFDDLDSATKASIARSGETALGQMVASEERALLASLIDNVLSELPVRQQFVLLEKYKRGKSLSDIGKAIRLDDSAVASLLHRARAAFRDKFERRMGGEKK